MSKLPGILVPPLTPFTEDLKIDFPALERQIEYILKKAKPWAITAAGVEAQEYHYLSMAQRKELIRRTVEFVDGRCPVMVGISHPSFKTSIELANLAADLKVHATQLLAPLRPFGGAPDYDDLLAYFTSVMAETDLPMLLYLNPGPGADVRPDWTMELSKLDKVHYVKESSRDMTRIGRLIHEIDHEGLARYFTTMQVLLPTLMLGGSGATMPPPGAVIAQKVVAAYKRGDFKEAARHQYSFTMFPVRWSRHGLAPALKAAMRIIGVPVGEPYAPFGRLTHGEREEMERYLREKTCLFD